jgi:c-di-GMP-binding flagellar brake protein YcgR
MNQLVAQFTAKREQSLEKAKQQERGASQRFYYRKELDQECIYRPVNSPKTVRLSGRVKDISLNGAGLEVRSKNALNFSHEAGDTFYFTMMLPTNKKLTFKAKIQSVKMDRTLGKILMGMQFEEMDGENRKTLGFFMRS